MLPSVVRLVELLLLLWLLLRHLLLVGIEIPPLVLTLLLPHLRELMLAHLLLIWVWGHAIVHVVMLRVMVLLLLRMPLLKNS